jgi:hypothetical protein
MSDCQARELTVDQRVEPKTLSSARAMPILLGIALATVAYATLGRFDPDTAPRLAAAFAGAASWPILARSVDLPARVALANLGAALALFGLAVLSLRADWALPAAYVGHAMWAGVLVRRGAVTATMGATWATLCAALACGFLVS